jgi:hypothetical protein
LAYQFADIMTKGLPVQLFLDFRLVCAFVILPLRLRVGIRLIVQLAYCLFTSNVLYALYLYMV